MKDLAPRIMLAVLLILAAMAVLLSCYAASKPVPMTGYITDKTYHPAYFPADYDTPWVYCLVIQDETATKCTSWQVSKEVYERYAIGQHVVKGWW